MILFRPAVAIGKTGGDGRDDASRHPRPETRCLGRMAALDRHLRRRHRWARPGGWERREAYRIHPGRIWHARFDCGTKQGGQPIGGLSE